LTPIFVHKIASLSTISSMTQTGQKKTYLLLLFHNFGSGGLPT
jgi:hypothetical protein